MKIRIFQSDKGDCLLLRTQAKGNILIDGGMSRSYKDHVRPFLGRMRDREEELDLVYVSHIDQDHIAGILQLVNDEMDWRRFLFQSNTANGRINIRAPGLKRPPKVQQVWHNAFHTLIIQNRGAIEDLLAASSRIWSRVISDKELQEAAGKANGLVTSKREAVKLSNRLSTRQLAIPLNSAFGGKLALRPSSPEEIFIAGVSIRVLGPSKADMEKLRKAWNKWLNKNRETIDSLREKAEEDAESIGNNTATLSAFLSNSSNRGGVTLPNLASLMLYVDEGGDSLLLTGDGHAEDILTGLEQQGLMRADGTCHVRALKIPHHGSSHNFEPKRDFFRRVTADHYIFCGDGSNTNPELDVLKLLFDSRLGRRSLRSKSAQVDHKFKLWFSSHESVAKPGNKAHMELLENAVLEKQAQNSDRFSAKFLTRSSFEFSI